MRPFERRPDRHLFALPLDPQLPALLPPLESGIAQDYRHYSLVDFQRRRRRGGPTWRDLYPAYEFARRTHAADWPRAPDIDDALAAQWEQMRGASRLTWRRARAVIEDAWRALDYMPEAAVHGATH